MDLIHQIAMIVGRHQPTREERMTLARLQAKTGIDAIVADDIPAAKAFLIDALDHLDQIKPESDEEEEPFGEGECACRRTGLGGNDPDAGWRLDRNCPIHGEDPDAAMERRRDDRERGE